MLSRGKKEQIAKELVIKELNNKLIWLIKVC